MKKTIKTQVCNPNKIKLEQTESEIDAEMMHFII